MEYAIITTQGGAKATAAELQEFGIVATLQGTDWCRAELTTEQLRLLHVRSQTATRMLQILATADTTGAFVDTIKGLVPSENSFCLRSNSPDRQEIEEELGGLIQDVTGAPVNLSKPDTRYFIHAGAGECIFGIDVFGDLSKRHYKIITGNMSLAGPVAACVLRIAGWTPKQDLIVWPCGTGELAIEAALWASGKSPRAYELQVFDEQPPKSRILAADAKLPMVRSCEKNAKVAGVAQYLRFSRQDADWLDTKHDERSVGLIVGLLPNLGVYTKLAKEVFYQLDFILKQNGTAAFLCVNDASAESLEAASDGYVLRREYIWSGKHTYTLVILNKQKKQKAARAVA